MEMVYDSRLFVHVVECTLIHNLSDELVYQSRCLAFYVVWPLCYWHCYHSSY